MYRMSRPPVARIWLLDYPQYPMEEQVTPWTHRVVFYLQWLLCDHWSIFAPASVTGDHFSATHAGGASVRTPVSPFEQHKHLLHPLRLPQTTLFGTSCCCSTAPVGPLSHQPLRSDTFTWCFLSSMMNNRFPKCSSATTGGSKKNFSLRVFDINIFALFLSSISNYPVNIFISKLIIIHCTYLLHTLIICF